MATAKTKKSATGTLSSEKLTELMNAADIKFKGKGEVPRDKVAILARKKMKELREQYTAMRKRIRASRYISKFATSDELTTEDIEMVDSLLTGKSTVTSDEFVDFTI